MSKTAPAIMPHISFTSDIQNNVNLAQRSPTTPLAQVHMRDQNVSDEQSRQSTSHYSNTNVTSSSVLNEQYSSSPNFQYPSNSSNSMVCNMRQESNEFNISPSQQQHQHHHHQHQHQHQHHNLINVQDFGNYQRISNINSNFYQSQMMLPPPAPVIISSSQYVPYPSEFSLNNFNYHPNGNSHQNNSPPSSYSQNDSKESHLQLPNHRQQVSPISPTENNHDNFNCSVSQYNNNRNNFRRTESPISEAQRASSNFKNKSLEISKSVLSSAIAIAEASVAAEAGHKSRKKKINGVSKNVLSENITSTNVYNSSSVMISPSFSRKNNVDSNQVNSLYPCEKCDKVFNKPYNLKSHQRTHSSEKPHVCKVCGRAFARAHDRRRHENLHKGEKKFRCSGFLSDGITRWGCERRFARADALGRHFRTETGWLCIRPLMEEAKELEKKSRPEDVDIDDYNLDNSEFIKKLIN